MRIGILTFHCAHNYGAVLQCYATQEFLRSNGYIVEVIDYRPEYLLNPYKLFNTKHLFDINPIRTIKNIIKYILTFRLKYRRWKGFNKFIYNYLNLSNRVYKRKIPSNYDIYIIGSDQIWNPQITNGFDPVFFGDFSFSKDSKRYIAYAASMESKNLNTEEKNFYKNSLRHFDSISVREIDLHKLLEPLIENNIKHVLDPTLMVSPNLWNHFKSYNPNHKKYVVVYQVMTNKNTLRIANNIAKQIGAEVRILTAWLQIKTKNTFQDATPEDFVNTIRNAACIITTSFHGTAFSVIFNRPFYTIMLNEGTDSRSTSLLKSLGLNDRLINMNDSPTFSTIDYTEPNKRLEILRKESQDFLLKALGDK